MLNTDRQLHIFFRHVHEKAGTNKNNLRPAWFSYEVCFQNLLSTIRLDPLAHRVNLTIVYDGSVEEFNTDFVAKYYANTEFGLKIQFIQGGSDSFSSMITHALARYSDLPENDLIYFLENDYMHQYGWVSKLFELYNAGIQFDYVSLYDHRDKYHYAMYANLTSRLVYSQSHHWRTAPSTCGTFILEKRILDRDYEIFRLLLPDFHLFTKLIGEMGRTLLTPVPGLATHSMAEHLSPTIDWEKLAHEATAGL